MVPLKAHPRAVAPRGVVIGIMPAPNLGIGIAAAGAREKCVCLILRMIDFFEWIGAHSAPLFEDCVRLLFARIGAHTVPLVLVF